MAETANGHVLYHSFGLESDNTTVLLKALDRLRGRVSSVAAQLGITEVYDTFYQLYHHDRHDAHPLATVMLHEKEKLGHYSKLHQRFLDYTTHDIRKLFGLGLDEYMSYPREFVELMNEIAQDKMQQDTKRTTETERKMQQQQDNLRRYRPQ